MGQFHYQTTTSSIPHSPKTTPTYLCQLFNLSFAPTPSFFRSKSQRNTMSPSSFLSSIRNPFTSPQPHTQQLDEYPTFAQIPISSHHTLYDVTLPGTHDSAAYATQPELLSRAHILPLQLRPIRALVASVQKDFALTQTLSILHQLRCGARFLDIRVSKRPSSTGDTRFWTVHGMVLCVPLEEIIQQINAFHNENSTHPVTIVTVFRSQQLDLDEEEELSHFVLKTLEHSIFEGDALLLRVTPIALLPPNVVAGLNGASLPVEWGRDPWLDTYASDKKIAFLRNTLEEKKQRALRDDLLVLGWTVTPQTMDITLRVLSFGFLRPGVKEEAAKMNAKFPSFLKQYNDSLRERANVIFFDCFSPKLAAMVGALNSSLPDTDDSADS